MYEDDEHPERAARGQARKATAQNRSSKPPPASSRIRPAPDPRLSRSVEYGIAILESFSRDRQALGIAEMADLVGISRSTSHRYAITLVALGYLEQDDKRKYRLSAQAADPGGAAIGAIRRVVPARTALEELRDELGQTVSMGVLEGDRVIYVHHLPSHRSGRYLIDVGVGVGTHIPVYCTAMGKVLLASVSDAERQALLDDLHLIPQGPRSIMSKSKLRTELDRISPREAVVSNEELVAGARSIAVLLPRPAGEPALALEVTVASGAYSIKRLRSEIGPRLKRTASLISGE
ncbi:MAG: IclR family transcriptional regulator [Solirubrobacteraceae bacterium]